LVIFSRDEQKQARMHASYPAGTTALRFLLGDVRDREALQHAMHGCDTVIHTAALKRVDNVACQPIEIKKTNVDGTQNVLEAALEAGVKKVLLVSTDKAVMPENMYGATKMLAEHLTAHFNAIGYPRGMRSSVVRFGNLWQSHGSVMDLWVAAAQAGQDLLITDWGMTRFIMTLKEACAFIMTALTDMEGGEVFVPKLQSFQLLDLAKAVLAVYGTDRSHIIPMGLRPGGEKIHERMLSDDEPKRSVFIHDHIVILPSHRTWSTEPLAGKPLDEGYTYSSDHGPFVSQENLALLLKEEPER
jgi:UDP-N-acetylglucosamine 4,6-dehydratase